MKKTIIWLAIFSIAMGFMESAVVIYLREIYYPAGFKFPLAPIESQIALVELLREVATIIMLLGVGILSAKTASLRFAYFIFCFAIWDLFYYVFLWVFLGWPESLFTWDILFLIPVPWVGPVITPCIVSLTLMLLSISIIYFERRGVITKIRAREWLVMSVGGLVIIISFIWDYVKYVQEKLEEIAKSKSGDLLSELKDYVPADFNWTVFLIGESILLFGILTFIIRINQSKSNNH